MAIELWLKADDRKRFEDVCDAVKLSPYQNSEGILTGKMKKDGGISALRKDFVLGRKGIWKPNGYFFVHVINNPVYRDGLILTPYSAVDVRFHLRGRTIDEKTNLSRIELLGTDTDDFVERVFRTYGDSQVAKKTERDNHLVLYEVI